jgi:hypothetical protein
VTGTAGGNWPAGTGLTKWQWLTIAAVVLAVEIGKEGRPRAIIDMVMLSNTLAAAACDNGVTVGDIRPAVVGNDLCGGWQENGNHGLVGWRARMIEAWWVSMSTDKVSGGDGNSDWYGSGNY